MKSNSWILVVTLGVLCILSAFLLCWHNVRQSKDAADASESVIEVLKNKIPDEYVDIPEATPPSTEEDLFAEYEKDEPESKSDAGIVIDKNSYCGYISLPSLGLELPVMSDWSYDKLNISPCRYSGSAETNDLIIAAHNFYSHFGKIDDLVSGDQIVFTNTLGKKYIYTVAYTEVIDGEDITQMFSGQSEEWDLTLFTCTLSGKSRVTVRADLVPEETT